MSDTTVDPKAWFKGTGSARASGAGNWFQRGTYLVEILSMKRQISEDPGKKKARQVITECKILEVITAIPGDPTYAPSNRKGEICTVYCNLDSQYPSMDLGRIKGQLEAVLGADAAEPYADQDDEGGWAALAAEVTEPPGTFLAGQRMIVIGTGILTKARKPITAVSFAAAPAPADAPAAA